MIHRRTDRDRAPRWARTVLLRAYSLVRPLVRPLGWRLRSFLIGPVRDEMAQTRAEVAALRAELAGLRAELVQRAAEASGPALDRRILDVIEQAVLTIALDREER